MKKLTYIALMIAAVCSVGCKSDVFYETDVTATPIVRMYTTTMETTTTVTSSGDYCFIYNATDNTYEVENEDADPLVYVTGDVNDEVITLTVDGVDKVCTIVDNASAAPQYYNYYYNTNELFLFSSTYVISDYSKTTKIDDIGIYSSVIKGTLTDEVLGIDHEYTGIEVSFYRQEKMIQRNAEGDPLYPNGEVITSPTADSPFVYLEDYRMSDGTIVYKTEPVKYVMRAESCTYSVGEDIDGTEYIYSVGSETGTVEIRRVSPYNNTDPELTFDESSVLMCPPYTAVQFEYTKRYLD